MRDTLRGTIPYKVVEELTRPGGTFSADVSPGLLSPGFYRRELTIYKPGYRPRGRAPAYRVHEQYGLKRDQRVLDCFRGVVTFDGRPIVDGAFDDLVKQVEANVCLEPDGRWRRQQITQ